MKDTPHSLKNSMRDMLGNDWTPERIRQVIGEHPEIAITTAIVGGLVLGWMLKRQ